MTWQTTVQTNLKKIGRYDGPIDGIAGKGTFIGVMRYIARSPIVEAATPMSAALPAAGIDTALELCHFMAQVCHESAGFSRLIENLSYSPERLLAVFPTRIKTLENAISIVAGGRNNIAEAVYGNRSDLGNTQPGDGAKFIGRGFIMATGRKNYKFYGDLIGQDLIASPELAAQVDDAVAIAVAYWVNTNGLRAAAQRDDLLAVSRIINLGNEKSTKTPNGMEDRTALLSKLKFLFGIA